MAVTLAQAAALETSPVRRGALETAVEVSQVWDRLPFENIEGNAYAYDKDKVLPGTAFRTVNEAYVESTGVINQDTERLVILGGDADVDQFIEKTMQSSRGVLMADQVRMKLESAQATYVDTMFNGDVEVDPKSFDGLRKRLIGGQVIDSVAPATEEAFLDELDALFGQVTGGAPDVVYGPGTIISRLKSLGRKVGGAEYINSEITGKREFTWNGVPFIDPGEHWSGRAILGVDPTNGGDLYAVKFASGIGVSGVLGITNGGLQAYYLGELDEKPAVRTRIDFYTGFVVQGGKAAARLRGVTTN
ncbi:MULTISPECIES: major capsid protein [unclassified Pseudactinotalea]|uniref:major capsid protein n=1 Tax=Micrococcales TaxID=85006 RepID=UPI003C7BF484